MTTPAPDPVEAIAAALTRLRGRRMPRPGWDGPPHHMHEHGDHGWGHDARHGRNHRGGPFGPPPWMAAARFGGPARLRLLEALASASGPLSVSQLGEAVGVDQPRASRLVQQAVELGLVRREADPDDARRTRIALTEQGRAIVQGFRGERRDAIAAALGSFSDDERADLARLLTKLADAWPSS